MSAWRGWRGWTRSPLAHFVVLGGVLLIARHPGLLRAPAPHTGTDRDPIVISAERVRTLSDEFTDRWGSPPSPAQARALVEQAAQEEMLFREARRLALGFGDGSVRRRLVEKMRLVGDHPGGDADALVREAIDLGLDDDVVIRRLLVEKMRLVLRQQAGATPIADGDLAAELERRRDALAQPARFTVTQVFLGADAHGARLAADARTLLARLRASDVPADGIAALSDPFPLGDQLRAYTRAQLVGRFGKSFADAVTTLAPGKWSGPLTSPYGLHLVRVEEQLPARRPALDEIRPTLTRAVLRERGQQSLAQGLARLRELYAVRIEGDDGTQGAGSSTTEHAS